MAPDHDGRGKPGVALLGVAGGQLGPERFPDPLGALGGGEVGAHGGSLSLAWGRQGLVSAVGVESRKVLNSVYKSDKYYLAVSENLNLN